MNDFEQKNKEDWQKIHAEIFGDTIPESYTWEKPEDIAKVLNVIGSYDDSNHSFFPSGGGLDLEGAVVSTEPGCIEVDFGFKHVLKPKKLTFEATGTNLEWNYFWLELDKLELSGVYDYEEDDMWDGYDEQLTELSPGRYAESYHMDNGTYHDEPLPKGARTVIRLMKGSIVIFKKTSIYNQNTHTYDGRHEKLGEDGFKQHIKEVYKRLGE